jgi:eukaryotic-like serine/threonine-protein kinase
LSATESFDELRVITLSGVLPGSGARQLKRGDLIGGSYRLKSLLGRGGMGYVFCAEHTIIEKQYALKMLAPELLNEQTRQRFEVEGRAIANLDHANIVKVYNMGLDNDVCPFYVMDLLDGESLADCITGSTRAGCSLTIGDSLEIALQMTRGLGYAHAKGIVHRDVKPSNVILLPDDNDRIVVKIVDFGIAKLLPSANLKNQSQTATGDIVGSPLYMSPEQCMGDNVDARSDIYSLGCTLFEMLSGHPPFHGLNAMETVMMHQNRPVPSLAVSRFFRAQSPAGSLDCLDGLDALIAKMMAKRPEQRYQTMEQVAHDIGRLKLGKSIAKSTGAAEDAGLSAEAESDDLAEEEGTRSGWGIAKKAALMLVIGCGFIATAAAACYLAQIVPHPDPSPVPTKEAGLRALLRPTVAAAPAEFRKLDDGAGDIFTAIPEIEHSKKSRGAPSAEMIAAAYKSLAPIKAQLVTAGGARFRRFVFPELPMGSVSEIDLPSPGNYHAATGSINVYPEGPLEYCVGDTSGSDFVVSRPEFFDKIDPSDFSHLALHGHRRSSLSSAFLEQAPVNIGFLHILKRAQSWTDLTHLRLKAIDLDKEIIAALNRLSVPSIDAISVEYRPDFLVAQPFLMRLREFTLREQKNVGPIMSAVAASKNLRRLAFNDCSLGVVDIAPLAVNKSIERLSIFYAVQFRKDEHQPDFLELKPLSGEDIILLAGKMSALHEICLGGIVLSPAEISALSHSRLKKIYLLRSSYSMAEQVRCKMKEPKVTFVDESFF